MIEIKNLTKTFTLSSGKVEALKDVSLTVKPAPCWAISRRQGASVKPAIGPKTARWGRVIFPIFRESILSLVLLDNGLQKLYTINKKGTVCEWSASFRHEIKKNDRRLWERGGHFFLLLEIVHVI